MRSRRLCTMLAAAGLGFATIGACSSSGRDLPAPTTTKPVVPQVITTVTAP